MQIKVYTDWGSRWNPWNAGIGVYITDFQGSVIEKRYKNLWVKTNNEAEYLGAYFGMKRAIEIWWKEIELLMDSKLVIEQLSGNWKIKKEELRQIHSDITSLIQEADIHIKYTWIARDFNQEADRLSNIAMDNLI